MEPPRRALSTWWRLLGPLAFMVGACCWLVAQAPAWADAVHLTNGQMIEGIVIRETDSQVVLQVAWEGFVVLDRDSIASIHPAEKPERERLLAQWKEEHRAYLEQEERRRQFDIDQRAKGFILYDGQWMTKEEVAVIQEKSADKKARRKLEEDLKQERLARKREEEERQSNEEELRTLNHRLRAMQEEQLRLQQEITALRYALTTRPLLPIGVPDFVRDEQGNLLRVRSHDGHLSVATPDGGHADLQLHNGHLSFTDHHGQHHDVESAR